MWKTCTPKTKTAMKEAIDDTKIWKDNFLKYVSLGKGKKINKWEIMKLRSFFTEKKKRQKNENWKKKWKGNLLSGRKYLQTVYLIKG